MTISAPLRIGTVGLLFTLFVAIGCGSAKVLEPPPLTPEEEQRLEENLKAAANKEGKAQPPIE